MKYWKRYIFIGTILIATGGYYVLSAGRPYNPDLSSVEFSPETPQDKTPQDTGKTRFPVAPIIPNGYEELIQSHPVDLETPQNLNPKFQYNPLTNRYELRSKIGDMDIVTPLTLTQDEYLKYSMQQSMDSYFKGKYTEEFTGQGEKKDDALSMFDFNFDLGPAEKLFGPGGVRLNASGSALIKMGLTNTKNGNPTLSERQRNKTTFDFDTQVQANIAATVGDKINFDLNYNTESTFDFDTKKLKLAYAGKEDEIIKVLEAGNVNMTTTNSLIRGGTALFGIKTELQFGKLTVAAVFSQQESQARTTSSKGNTQTTPFEIKADQYDNNKHFLLGHYFYDNYDTSLRSIPLIRSGISIDKIEVWKTNKQSNFDQARNIVAFIDLGETEEHIYNKNLVKENQSENGSYPSNKRNNLYSTLTNGSLGGARDISQVNQVLGAVGFTNAADYEKIESARLLSSSEYTYNPQLGYLSLRSELQSDEVLAVAYSYTYNGQTYQVGEFSTDNAGNTAQTLYVKLLKGTTSSPDYKTWKLMMKNVYNLTNGSQLSNDDFRLDIKYQNDTVGTYLNYFTEDTIANIPLLRVLNLDRLDSRNNPYPDGLFDYVEGLTVNSSNGNIIFTSIEPFGSYLENKFKNKDIAQKYVFKELYDSTLTIAQQTAEKNKFILSGEYKGSNNSNISLSGFNVAKGSVAVTANGVRLRENIDYTVDYTSGNVTIINPVYENATINVSSEDQSGFGMQRKTMMGMNLNYAFNPKFNIGATIMNLSEMPTTLKVQPGMESVDNTVFGFNVNFATQSQALTNLLDKIPLLDLTAPSQISINAEYAQIIPGHYKSEYGGDYSYIDDFENAKKSIELRSPYSWALSSTPSMFNESALTNNVLYGNNRSLLAWYYIDAIFTRKSSLTPNHIKNDDTQLSNHYVREILESELYPDKDVTFNQSSSIPVLNLAYYPKERGPYNVDATGTGTDGYLLNPEKRWGGITRRIESGQTDFEAQNIETIEFWLLDPFIYNPNSDGGDLYINLGEISEDVLKDEKKFFENGIPIDGDLSKVDSTVWGYVPKQQSLNYAFDNTEGARKIQDVGLNGLSTEQERTFSTYANYRNELEAKLTPEARQRMQEDQFSPFNDPAGDNYHYFRGSDYDDANTPILARYKHYNGTEGNSADQKDSPESYNTAARLSPDVEDINQDYTLNETEKYFQYRIKLTPQDLVVGQNHIVQKMEVKPSVKKDDPEHETVTWYQFKIPIKDVSAIDDIVGNIKDFKTIRFMRMFMTNFSDSVVLRFGSFELVHGDWRSYTQNPDNSNSLEGSEANLTMSVVNLEENGSKQPVNYIMPPGVNRILDPGQTQLRQQNEQALSLKITDIGAGDARAIYRSSGMDMRQYRRMQMFTHAEKLVDDLTDLQNNDLSIFIRLGSDYKNNYYEYEIPLTLTPAGKYNQSISSDREQVWPESNMFDFAFDLLTNLKIERNKEKQQPNSGVTFYTPYSNYDPNKPMNKMTVLGNPSISDVKVIMVGIRNNSRSKKSAEIWINELRLTEFNEDGGWAGNANVFLGLSDLGSVNFAGRKETAGFGGIDDGIMDRNMDDTHNINLATQVELGKFFPEKAKVSIPLNFSYRQEVVSPKYNPLDQDILLQDALDAVETKAEKDSIKSFAVDKVTAKTVDLNNVRVNIQSKKPMPYDPANFTFSYSSSNENTQNSTTEYERETNTRLNMLYSYSPQIKPWQPFKKVNTQNKTGDTNNTNTNSNANSNRNNAAANKAGNNRGFLQDIEIRYLPNNLSFNSDISRKYYELQLRDVGSGAGGENMIPPSFSEDFYWNRSASIQWNLTKNLNLNFTTNTNAQIETPHVQVNKQLDKDSYELWKDSVIKNIKNFGNPLEYNQTFTATYSIPFRSIPALNFMTANLRFNSTYQWQRGATLEEDEEEGENIELGNTIRNNRVIGLENVSVNLENLYNKSTFLSEVNKKYTMKQARQPDRNAAANRNARRNVEESAAKEKRNKKFEQEIKLNPDSATTIKHQLDNKRVRVTARREDGKIYEIKFKSIDKNTIQIKNKDSVNLKISISQLPPLEELQWYKIAQGTARALMMVRTFGFSYNETSGLMLPNFRPGIGNFNGQGNTPNGYAPGFDFAFGLTGEDYVQKAIENDWLIKNTETNISPAIFSKSETFNLTATLEPFTDFKVSLTGVRTKSNQSQLYFMYDNAQRKYSGDFRMTTIGFKSIFEMGDAGNGYQSKTFNEFLRNRDIIASRLENAYAGTYYPGSGFLAESSLANTPYDPANGKIERNSADVLVPAFLAAYTGKNAHSISLTAFPALSSLLPNWSITYGGLMQLAFMQKYFKSFRLEHKYDCTYAVGAFSSFLSWVPANTDGLGYIQSVAENPIPSSPYDITAVSLLEAFNPLFGINSVFQNNASLKLQYNMSNNINLNMSSFQIIEVSKREFVFGLGYRFENFNKVLKIKKTGGANFNNELNVSASISYSRLQNLIRKIEDNLTQAQSGDSQTVLKLSADYKMSKMITMQAFFDKQISNPLVSATAYPVSTSSFGISCRINLSR